MASSSTQPASSSSSPASRSKYDVFLSFCGKDTRNGFVSHLYAALIRKGIFAFKDDEKLERGEYFSEQLLKAIQESMSAVIIISPNYASSKWCLTELTEIIKCEKKTGLTILPVFYKVEPHDVRNKKLTFAEAFADPEQDPQIDMEMIQDPRIDMEMIQLWKASLKQVGYICGWPLQERPESTVVEDITARIFSQLNNRLPLIYRNLVGIDTSVEKMMNLLGMGLNDVRFIGICGMGGIGKTTLAEVIYDSVSYQFEASIFISSIREKSENHGLVSLQDQLISKILVAKEIQIRDVREGINVIRNRMQHRKILIVLDDVSTDKQLEALAGSHDWFGPGSRIIVTSRDSHLLKRNDVTYLCEINVLNNEEALKLFSLWAFKKVHPDENYMDLSESFIEYAQGLPLALRVLGSSLFGRTRDAWKSALDQLKANPKKEILDVLEICFNGLEVLQKELFLDIAFFFKGEKLNDVVRETLESSGYYPGINIEVLKEKSLITISCFGTLEMHDLLQDMSKEIVRRKSPTEPGQRSRLWHHDVLHVLKNNTGTNAVEGIVLKLPLDTKERLNIGGFSKMKNLRILKLGNIILVENLWDKLCTRIGLRHPLESIPTKKLRIMKWEGYPFKSLPTNFEANKLVELNFSYSRNIEELWKGRKSFGSLKRLNMEGCSGLIKTPDFTEIQNLKYLNLSRCYNLSHVHQSIGVLKRLKTLLLACCKSVTNLPFDMTGLESLRRLNLTGCTKLEQIPETGCTLRFKLSLSRCSRIKKLPDLSGSEFLYSFDAMETAITNFPSPSLLPKKWEEMRVSGCSDRQAEWGEFLWLNMNVRSLNGIVSQDYDQYASWYEDPPYGLYLQCERNFLEGLYFKNDREYDHNMLYFGLDRVVREQGLPFEKERDIFDFIMTGASLGSNSSRCSEWFNNITTVPVTNPKLKGCSLFFVFEYHGPPCVGRSLKEGPPLIPFACIFKRDFSVQARRPLFLWAPAIADVGPIEFWAFVPATWFLEFLRWPPPFSHMEDLHVDVKDCSLRLEYKDDASQFYNAKDCRFRLVYEDDASQFYSTVAPHALHSKYYEQHSYRSEETNIDEETDSEEEMDMCWETLRGNQY